MYPHSFCRKERTNEFRFKPGLFGKIIIEQKVLVKTYEGRPPKYEVDLKKPIETLIKWEVIHYDDLIDQNLINVTMQQY